MDHEVTLPVTEGVTVFIAVPWVKENVFGEYEIDGAERPPVIIGSLFDEPNSSGPSCENHSVGNKPAILVCIDSVITVICSPFEFSSKSEEPGGVFTTPEDNDIVTIIVAKNNDLMAFFCSNGDKARSLMEHFDKVLLITPAHS